MGDRISPEAVARDREKSRARAAARRASDRKADNERMRKYRMNNAVHINETRRARYGEMSALADRPFIGWDGEGYTDASGKHHYMLFGCSMFPDDPIVSDSLSTKACLEYIFHVESLCPNAFHVGFAFDYDVNMILRDLPSRFLRLLAKFNRCHWEGYRIEYIPSKYFRVSKGSNRGGNVKRISVTIYDAFGFFHSKYTTSLLKFSVATREEIRLIEEGKEDRPNFTFENIEYVKRYWQDEISYFPPLMECIREACYDAGLFITAWHGPGALATYILRVRGVKEWKSKEVPPEAQIAIQTAYAGGRFQPWRCGLSDRPVYTADINSAYIYACSLLPRLDNRRWRRIPIGQVDRTNIARFGVYRISYDAGTANEIRNHERGSIQEIHPLFRRSDRGQVSWPLRVEGWYWSPEARLVADNPNARFLEAWVYDDDGTYPFEWVSTEFDKRLELQHEGNPAEKTFKWALAAMYGAFAQLVGWDMVKRKPPPKHELAWAGFITSWCRAEVYRVAYECWKRDGLISIDTDGVTSTVPFNTSWLKRGVGEKLGQWKLESFTGILYWQTGFYWLRDSEGQWTTAKTRGIPRGSLDINAAFDALENSEYVVKGVSKHATIVKEKTRFVGFMDALSRHAMKEWRTWITVEYESRMGGGGPDSMGSYLHFPPWCGKCRNPDANIMHIISHRVKPTSHISVPHKLPWLLPQSKMPENIIESIYPDTTFEDNL